ncbi:uncharacterized protein LOC122297078 isoform X2 [Carya illinoinensis]|uniref:uncharacterized protein LOC122297078 isoform X2 n=1 Tax=Carya illinoinensis TaxID=32201 RepID=UPI001C71E65E|nr:uncharacterized protein LOC122297078 isoform X2 [Carya illinoinensis]
MRNRVMMIRVVANGSTSCPCRILFLSPREMTLLLPRISLLEDNCWLSIQEQLHFIRQLLSITIARESRMKYQWMLPSAKTTTSKLFALLRVPGCCIRCKRMWHLLELHSRLCTSYDVCRVPFVQGHLNYILQLQQLKTLSLGAYSELGELRKKEYCSSYIPSFAQKYTA